MMSIAYRLRHGLRASCRNLTFGLLVSVLSLASAGLAAAQVWQPLPAPPYPLTDVNATLLQDGRVLIIGSGGLPLIFDPGRMTWTELATAPAALDRPNPIALVMPDSRILISHGEPGTIASPAYFYDPLTDVWTLLAGPLRNRRKPAGVLLADGRVLVGGTANDGAFPLNTELYDPIDNTWTASGSISISRQGGQFVTLPNGHILSVGGSLPPETYDPATGTWTPAGAVPSQTTPAAILMSSGKVLVTGDASGLNVMHTSIYDAVAGTWDTWLHPGAPLRRPGLALLPDGRVLAAGGDEMTPLASHFWDHTNRTWTAGPLMNVARHSPRLVVLPDGRVLAFGGVGAATTPFAEALVLAPTVSSSGAGDPNAGRFDHGSVVLPDGRLFVVGGAGAGLPPFLDTAAVYRPDLGTWQAAAPMVSPRGNDPEPMLLRDGRVIVIGGTTNSNQGIAATDIYDGATLAHSAGPDMLAPRTLQRSVSLKNGWLFVTGGGLSTVTPAIATTEMFVPELNRFLPAAPMPEPRKLHQAVRLLDDRVLVMGGIDAANIVRSEAWIYDYRTNSWTATGSLLAPMQEPDAFTLPDGRVLVVAKDAGTQLWDPVTGTWSAAGTVPDRFERASTQLADGSVVIIGGRFGGMTAAGDVLLFDPTSSAWLPAGTLLTPRSSALAATLPDGRVIVSGGADSNLDPIADVELIALRGVPDATRRPILGTVTNLANNNTPLVTGAGFATGYAGSGNGDGATSAQNYPSVLLTSLITGERRFLPIDSWSDISATGGVISGLTNGPSMVQVITNGVASEPWSLAVNAITPTLSTNPAGVGYSAAPQVLQFVATLQGGPIADGNVAWFFVTNSLGEIIGLPAASSAAAGHGQLDANWTAPAGLATGPYTIWSVYAGDAIRTPAWSSSTLVVQGVPTQLTVTPPAPTVPRRSTSAVSASVVPAYGAPITGGTIALSNGPSSCSFAAPSGSCDLAFGAPGTVSINGTFTPASPATLESTGSASVEVVCTAMVMAPAMFSTATVGEAYSQAVTASDAFGAYQITLASGALPEGVTLLDNVLSGTPSASGVSTFTLRVSDADSCSSTQVFSITTDPAPITERVYTLAEGVSNAYFSSVVLVANPNETSVPITFSFAGESGATATTSATLGPLSRMALSTEPGTVPAGAGTTFSTRVTSTTGAPLLVERATFFDAARHAGHLSTATDGDGATAWSFAEGANGFFHTYLTLGNLHDEADAAVRVRYLPEGGAPFERQYSVPRHSRLTIDTRAEAALAATAFAMSVESTVPIAADRVQYFGDPFIGGHADSGARALSTDWYFAEGASGPVFDTFLLLANPSADPATATVTYHTDGGEIVTRTHPIAAGARVSIPVESEDARLTVGAYWIEVHADRSIVAERAMYLAGGSGWVDATATGGATAPATRWGFAAGESGRAMGYATYVLLANPGTREAEVEVQYLRETGAPVTRAYRVAPGARVTLDVRAEEPSLADAAFGIVVRSTNSEPIIAERSLYWTLGGPGFVGAMSSMGIPLIEH